MCQVQAGAYVSLLKPGYPRPCDFSSHIGPFHLCAFFRIVRFRRESVAFFERSLISFGFSDLPRSQAPLCDHGL